MPDYCKRDESTVQKRSVMKLETISFYSWEWKRYYTNLILDCLIESTSPLHESLK